MVSCQCAKSKSLKSVKFLVTTVTLLKIQLLGDMNCVVL